MKKKVNIEEIIEKVRERANYEDANASRKGFWKQEDIKNRLYDKVINPWDEPSDDDKKKAEEIYLMDIKNLKPIYGLKIGQKKTGFSDAKKINKHLLPKHFYFWGRASGGKDELLLGELKEHRKTRINKKKINEFIIGDELVCNMSFFTVALADTKEGLIISRTKCEEYSIWNCIRKLKQNKYNTRLTNLLSKAFSNLGLKKEELLRAEPKSIKKQVEEIAKKSLEASLSHERGHFLERKHFPHKALCTSLEHARKHKDDQLQGFIYALSDSLADTLETKKLKGKLPHILSLKKPERDGLFYLICSDIALTLDAPTLKEIFPNPELIPQTLKEIPKLEAELLSALPAYEETGDAGVLKDAFNIICERSKSLAKKVRKAKNYHKLKKIQKEFETEHGLK